MLVTGFTLFAKTCTNTALTLHALTNQNIFLLLNIPMDETNPVSRFWEETLSSIKSRFPNLS